MSRHLDKAQAYFEKRRAHDAAKAESDRAYKAMQATERELVDAMLDEHVQNFTLGDGLMVSMKEEFAMAVNKENEFQVSQWLQETEGDVRQFVKESLHKPTIVKHIKDLIEKGALERSDVPAFFALNTYPSVQVRGWNKET